MDSPFPAQAADAIAQATTAPTPVTVGPPNAGRRALNVAVAVVLVFGTMFAGFYAYDTPWVRFTILLLPVGVTLFAAARKRAPTLLAGLFAGLAMYCGAIAGAQSVHPADFVDDAFPTLATLSAIALLGIFMLYSLRPGSPLRLNLAAARARPGRPARQPPQWLANAIAVVFACAAAGSYGYGVFTALDEDLDHAMTQTFHATVQARHYTSRHGGGTYTLRLSSWGPFPEPRDVSVARNAYHQLAIGQTACIALHPGLLGARWFSIARC